MNTATKPTRHAAARILDLLQVGSLGVCVGVVFSTGAAAAGAFPIMRKLDPTLPGYDAVSDHWLIAAGSAMLPTFTVTSGVIGACLIIAAIALIASILIIRAPKNRIALFIRVGLLALTMAIYTHYRAVLTPRMNTNFSSFLAAAEDDDVETAESFRAAFRADHPSSRFDLGAIGLLSLLGALSVGMPIARRRKGKA